MRNTRRRKLRHILLPPAAVYFSAPEKHGREQHRISHGQSDGRRSGADAHGGDRRHPAGQQRGDSSASPAQPQIFGGSGRGERLCGDGERFFRQRRTALPHPRSALSAHRFLGRSVRQRGNARLRGAPQAGGLPQNTDGRRGTAAKVGLSRRMERLFRQR